MVYLRICMPSCILSLGHLRFGCSSPKEMNEWIENIHLALADERRENATARELQDKSTKGVVGKGQEIDIESTSSPIEGESTDLHGVHKHFPELGPT